MAGGAVHAAVTREVLGLCASGLDARQLQRRVLDALRPAVHFDAFVWVLTDPESCVGAAPFADVPCLAELPKLVRLKYATALNRWTSLRRNEVALLHSSTRGQLSRSLLWRELLTSYDVQDVASTVFRDRFGCWGFLDLWRVGAGRRPFAHSDAELMASLGSRLTSALRGAQAATFTARSTEPRRDTGAVVLLLSPTLQVKAQTPQTRDYLAGLLPPPIDEPPIPAAAYNVAAQLLAVEAGVDEHVPLARVHLAGGRWLTLRAARIGEGGAAAGRDIAVTIEESAPADRLTVFGSAFGMTPREKEVLRHLAGGHDNRHIATALVVSEHTVNDHVKSMLAKTALRSRSALLSLALARPSPTDE